MKNKIKAASDDRWGEERKIENERGKGEVRIDEAVKAAKSDSQRSLTVTHREPENIIR